MEQGVLIYTTAPSSYDGFGTTTVGVFGLDGRGVEIRVAKANPRHADWQRMRYQSGLKLCADEAKITELVDNDLVLQYGEREHALLAKASSMPASTVSCLQIVFATGVPAYSPAGGDVHPFLRHDGKLTDEGRDLAALTMLRDEQVKSEGKRKALRWLTARRKAG